MKLLSIILAPINSFFNKFRFYRKMRYYKKFNKMAYGKGVGFLVGLNPNKHQQVFDSYFHAEEVANGHA